MSRRDILVIAATMLITIWIGLTWRLLGTKARESQSELPQASWNGDISSISGKEFWRQLEQYGLIQQKNWPTVFRRVEGAVSKGILPWLNRLELSEKTLLDGPHIETISLE